MIIPIARESSIGFPALPEIWRATLIPFSDIGQSIYAFLMTLNILLCLLS